MIGSRLESANNVLTLIVEDRSYEKDDKLKQASFQLSRALQAANDLPELKTAYESAVNAFAEYTACPSQQP